MVVGLVLVLLPGCATKGTDSSNPAVSLNTARMVDIRQRRMVFTESFSRQDQVAAVIKNLTWGDQVLQVEFIRQDTGLVVWKNVLSVPRGQVHYAAPIEPLPGGNYTVKVSGTGILPAVSRFTVYGY